MIELHLRSVVASSVDIFDSETIMKTQLQAALANTQTAPTGGTTPPAPPVATAPAPTLLQRITAASTLAVLLQLEAEARTSAEQGAWLVYLDAVSILHAASVAARVKAAATKAAADAATAQAAADALLQSSILKLVDKFAPMLAAVPTLLAQVQPALDAYRASRGGNATIATIINAVANAPMPLSAASDTADIPVDQMTDEQKRACGIMVW